MQGQNKLPVFYGGTHFSTYSWKNWAFWKQYRENQMLSFFSFHQFATIRHGDWAFSPITYPPIGLSCRSTGNLIFSHAKTAEPDPILSDGTAVFCQTSCDFALSGLCFPRQKLLPIHWWMRQPSTAGQWADHHAGITAKTKQHPIFVLPFFSLLL